MAQTPAVQVKDGLEPPPLRLRLPADDLGRHQAHLEHVDDGPVLRVPLACGDAATSGGDLVDAVGPWCRWSERY